MRKVYVALENLRSLHNIGAIFRTCSFFGVRNVILVGYSGKTYDLKGNTTLHPDILKTSLGSEEDLEITFIKDSHGLIEFKTKSGMHLVSVEQAEKSVPVERWRPKEDSIIVFGNEVDGVSKEVLDASDEILEISRHGKHNSLNVATTCGIVLYQLSIQSQENLLDFCYGCGDSSRIQ